MPDALGLSSLWGMKKDEEEEEKEEEQDTHTHTHTHTYDFTKEWLYLGAAKEGRNVTSFH